MVPDEFNELRRSALAIAYRMLGSVSEAEDVVQEGLLRLHQAREGGARISSPRAYLSTVVTRLSLDELRSARIRREAYVGEWLPDPLVAATDDDPAAKLEMADSLSLAFLVMLERLSPKQRAAFLLHDVFDEPYIRIAEIIDTSEQNARQLVARARHHVGERRPRFEASRQQQEQLAIRFFAAAEEGDLEGLEALLAHDVVLHSDGGGKAPTIARVIHGRIRVARTLIAGLRAGIRLGGFTSRRAEVNCQPGALFIDDGGRLGGVMVLDIEDGQIQSVSSIVNPDKLRHLGPVADLAALQRGETYRHVPMSDRSPVGDRQAPPEGDPRKPSSLRSPVQSSGTVRGSTTPTGFCTSVPSPIGLGSALATSKVMTG